MRVKYDAVLDELREDDSPFAVVSSLPTGWPGQTVLLSTDSKLYVKWGTWQSFATLTPPSAPSWFGGLLLDLPTG